MSHHKPLLKRLIIISSLMFVFAFALVPLYDIFCDVTGLNGKPSMLQAQASESVNVTQQVDVGFITHSQDGAPFKVSSETKTIKVNTGEMNKVTFNAQNLSDKDRVLQAVPSVSPGLAAQYLHKVECFCFQQQPIKAGENVDMTLLFYVDEELPAEIEEMTLSYTLFDISDDI